MKTLHQLFEPAMSECTPALDGGGTCGALIPACLQKAEGALRKQCLSSEIDNTYTLLYEFLNINTSPAHSFTREGIIHAFTSEKIFINL